MQIHKQKPNVTFSCTYNQKGNVYIASVFSLIFLVKIFQTCMLKKLGELDNGA
jgi:hypothetical protein